MLKAIQPPSMEEFDELIARAREAARRAGLTPEDVEKAVAEARGAR